MLRRHSKSYVPSWIPRIPSLFHSARRSYGYVCLVFWSLYICYTVPVSLVFRFDTLIYIFIKDTKTRLRHLKKSTMATTPTTAHNPIRKLVLSSFSQTIWKISGCNVFSSCILRTRATTDRWISPSITSQVKLIQVLSGIYLGTFWVRQLSFSVFHFYVSWVTLITSSFVLTPLHFSYQKYLTSMMITSTFSYLWFPLLLFFLVRLMGNLSDHMNSMRVRFRLYWMHESLSHLPWFINSDLLAVEGISNRYHWSSTDCLITWPGLLPHQENDFRTCGPGLISITFWP